MFQNNINQLHNIEMTNDYLRPMYFFLVFGDSIEVVK